MLMRSDSVVDTAKMVQEQTIKNEKLCSHDKDVSGGHPSPSLRGQGEH